MFKLFSLINTLTQMATRLTATAAPRHHAARGFERDERGEAVPWLIVLGAGIAIAYFAGDAVMAFAKSLVGQLGN
jgi:hypothetical protein